MFTIHVIDDDEAVRDSLDALLTTAGYDVSTFESAEAFLAGGGPAAAAPDGDCVLLDLHMPGMTGLDLLRELRARQRQLSVLLLTASRDERLHDQARDLGAVECLTKPVPDAVLIGAVERARSGRGSR